MGLLPEEVRLALRYTSLVILAIAMTACLWLAFGWLMVFVGAM